ncbi:TPA: hypothetical protein QCX47_004334, partial [Bacillus mycoides]|nr:hypothetical protein [Bacillus mycoides]
MSLWSNNTNGYCGCNNTNGYCGCNNTNGVHVDSCCFSCDGTVPKLGPTG